MGLKLVLLLCLISFTIALFTYLTSKKTGEKRTEVYAIPVLTIASMLFTTNEGIDTRVQIATIIVVAYVLSYFLFMGIYNLWRLITKKDNSTNSIQPKKLSIKLPVDNFVTLETSFLEDFPIYVERLFNMCENIRPLIEKFCLDYSNSTTDEERETCLKTFFIGICYHLTSLFTPDSRVHVRRFNGSAYEKYVATYDNSIYSQGMKVMSFDNKMIKTSFEQRCSLIKSINMNLHEEGNNRKWKNYLMFALPQITHNNKPVFTIGISIRNKRNEMFYFLNYCEIESIIGRYFQEIVNNNQCDVESFVERFYFSQV